MTYINVVIFVVFSGYGNRNNVQSYETTAKVSKYETSLKNQSRVECCDIMFVLTWRTHSMSGIKMEDERANLLNSICK